MISLTNRTKRGLAMLVVAGELFTFGPTVVFADGDGMGGGMMGPTSNASGSSRVSNYGMATLDGPSRHYKSDISKDGAAFMNVKVLTYFAGSMTAPDGKCEVFGRSLMVGDFGKVRFTKKGNELLARITLRGRTGKIVTKVVKHQCGGDSIEEPANVSESILSKTVSVTPGKDVRTKVGNLTVTISLDKSFPVAAIPVWPVYTSPDSGSTRW